LSGTFRYRRQRFDVGRSDRNTLRTTSSLYTQTHTHRHTRSGTQGPSRAGSPFTSAYLDRRCTGRFRDLREVQVVRVQTAGAQSTRTCYYYYYY